MQERRPVVKSVRSLAAARRRQVNILGVFSGLTGDVGGIQTAGRIAWEAINRQEADNSGDAVLFHYGEGCGHPARVGPPVVEARSKWAALAAALQLDLAPKVVIFWHLSLLRLVPFLDLSRARVIVFLHGIEAWKRQGIISKRLLKRVDLFLTNSDHTWRYFIEANPSFAQSRHRTVWLGTGSPVGFAVPGPQDPPAALMVGRLARGEDYKGHREMVAAWPLVVERIPGAQLWIAGDGDLRPALEASVRQRGLEPHVRFWGRVSEDAKERLLASCRCLAMPSHGEGFGLVYAEAMRVGRPCLVSVRDGGHEIVNPPEAGLAANRDRPEELAGAVCRLLTPGRLWDGWSEAARRRYEGFFSAAHFKDRLIAALSEV
jgi:phosphatidylinositol alpha-1,6-mannosyltransferase